jgi:hypothetical protein
VKCERFCCQVLLASTEKRRRSSCFKKYVNDGKVIKNPGVGWKFWRDLNRVFDRKIVEKKSSKISLKIKFVCQFFRSVTSFVQQKTFQETSFIKCTANFFLPSTVSSL